MCLISVGPGEGRKAQKGGLNRLSKTFSKTQDLDFIKLVFIQGCLSKTFLRVMLQRNLINKRTNKTYKVNAENLKNTRQFSRRFGSSKPRRPYVPLDSNLTPRSESSTKSKYVYNNNGTDNLEFTKKTPISLIQTYLGSNVNDKLLYQFRAHQGSNCYRGRATRSYQDPVSLDRQQQQQAVKRNNQMFKETIT